MSGRGWLLRLVVFATVLVLRTAMGLAQERPVVFLHGFKSSGSDWAATAARLRTDVQIDPRLPTLDWKQHYGQQAQALVTNASYASLPANSVAIGHSNGGIVAREWSKSRTLGGIVTLGSPHGGAPITLQFNSWVAFQTFGRSLVGSVVQAFAQPSGWSWAIGPLQTSLGWVADFSVWSVAALAARLGIDGSMPVLSQMTPGSSYLNALNSSANLDRERLRVGARVGIVSVARNFFLAGPARAISPDNADVYAGFLYSAAGLVLGWSGHILAFSDPSDIGAIRQSAALASLGSYLLAVDPYYCDLVTGGMSGYCVPNDGILPYTRQMYPGAPNIHLGDQNDGPAHTQEMSMSDDALYAALVHYIQVPARFQPTPTPPPPPPPGGGGTGSGGAGGMSGVGTDRLLPGDVLHANQMVSSADGRYHFIYQGDGHLVLYDEAWAPIWESGTAGITPGFVVMQNDGNFVMYDASSVPVWSSEDSLGHDGAYLLVQNDGNVVIYTANDVPLWETGTAR